MKKYFVALDSDFINYDRPDLDVRLFDSVIEAQKWVYGVWHNDHLGGMEIDGLADAYKNNDMDKVRDLLYFDMEANDNILRYVILDSDRNIIDQL